VWNPPVLYQITHLRSIHVQIVSIWHFLQLFVAVRHCAVMGVSVRFEDDSVEASSTVRQWNCSIISVSTTVTVTHG